MHTYVYMNIPHMVSPLSQPSDFVLEPENCGGKKT